jgi:hypothetical protein
MSKGAVGFGCGFATVRSSRLRSTLLGVPTWCSSPRGERFQSGGSRSLLLQPIVAYPSKFVVLLTFCVSLVFPIFASLMSLSCFLRFEQVASVFESRVIFGIVHVDEAVILKRFGVDESSAPKLVIQPQFKGDRSTVTHFDGEIEFASICSFVANGLHASLFGKAPHPSNYGKAVLNDTGILPEVPPYVHFSVLFFSSSRDIPSEVTWLAKVFQDVVAVSVVPPRNELIRNSFRVEANSAATAIAIHPKVRVMRLNHTLNPHPQSLKTEP